MLSQASLLAQPPIQPAIPMPQRRREDTAEQMYQFAKDTLEGMLERYPIKCMDDIE